MGLVGEGRLFPWQALLSFVVRCFFYSVAISRLGCSIGPSDLPKEGGSQKCGVFSPDTFPINGASCGINKNDCSLWVQKVTLAPSNYKETSGRV